jgi:hypothetical protein
MSDPRRASDRWITPGVVMVALLVAGGLVALLIAVVGYLTVRGYDPAPLLDLTAKIVTAVGSFGTLLLTLASRRTTTKVERNTGVQASELAELKTEVGAIADKVYEEPAAPAPFITGQPRGAHAAATGKLPPVPPARC